MQNIAQTVHDTFLACLYTEEEIASLQGATPQDAVIVDTIRGKVGFHPQRLEASRDKVIEVIREMPLPFRPTSKGGGDGWWFLNLCMTKDEVQWAEHPTMNELIALAFALKLGKFCLPREYWGMLPGGMPYLVLDDEEVK